MAITIGNVTLNGSIVVTALPATGGGSDVIPSNTSWWDDAFAPSELQVTTNTIQIQGIDTTISLKISYTGMASPYSTVYASVNTTNAYGGTITSTSTGPTGNITFSVSNNQYVTFRLDDAGGGNAYQLISCTVTNESDGGTVLDTFTMEYDNT
jgi:hypothetical protein